MMILNDHMDICYFKFKIFIRNLYTETSDYILKIWWLYKNLAIKKNIAKQHNYLIIDASIM